MHKINVAKIRTLRSMCDKTRKDRIKNEHFLEHLGVATVGDKLRDSLKMVWTCPT